RFYFLKLVSYQHSRNTDEREKTFQDVLVSKAKCLEGDWDRQSLEFFTHWYHSAIFELLHFDSVKDDPAWIAKNLKPAISPSKAKEALTLLENLKMVAFDEEKKRLVPITEMISTGSEIRGMTFKSYHHQMINLALTALSKEIATNRDISSVTISLPVEAMNEIKELTAKFRQELLQLSDRHKEKEQIIQVNIQAFPLSIEIKKGKED
ncbi:MAG: TIGR02147 family protein, partial [Oligoflexales bacterium]|nr:TIGR02147 family protein [Oligoflexales bacterium]